MAHQSLQKALGFVLPSIWLAWGQDCQSMWSQGMSDCPNPCTEYCQDFISGMLESGACTESDMADNDKEDNMTIVEALGQMLAFCGDPCMVAVIEISGDCTGDEGVPLCNDYCAGKFETGLACTETPLGEDSDMTVADFAQIMTAQCSPCMVSFSDIMNNDCMSTGDCAGCVPLAQTMQATCTDDDTIDMDGETMSLLSYLSIIRMGMSHCDFDGGVGDGDGDSDNSSGVGCSKPVQIPQWMAMQMKAKRCDGGK